MGHFTELKIEIGSDDHAFEIPDSVVQGVTRAALANSNLEVLHLSTQDVGKYIDWNPHVEMLLDSLQHHGELCTLKLEVRADAFGPDFCHLRRFLSSSRKITVTDREGRLHSDGASIDKLYALNRLYWGSAGLIGKPLSERSSLVATALMESASGDLRRCALLLSDHTDASHDLVLFARLDELGGGEDDSSL